MGRGVLRVGGEGRCLVFGVGGMVGRWVVVVDLDFESYTYQTLF